MSKMNKLVSVVRKSADPFMPEASSLGRCRLSLTHNSVNQSLHTVARISKIGEGCGKYGVGATSGGL